MPSKHFQKGNPGGPGRPPRSINKGDLLLSQWFIRNGFNYFEEFLSLLKQMEPKEKFKELKELLPYLVAEVQLMPISFDPKAESPEESVEAAKEAQARIRALEKEANAAVKKGDPNVE